MSAPFRGCCVGELRGPRASRAADWTHGSKGVHRAPVSEEDRAVVPGFTERDGLAAEQRRRQLVADAQRRRFVTRHVAARDAARSGATAPRRGRSSRRGASTIFVRFAAPWAGAFRLTARP